MGIKNSLVHAQGIEEKWDILKGYTEIGTLLVNGKQFPWICEKELKE
jgi:hypothetical protein